MGGLLNEPIPTTTYLNGERDLVFYGTSTAKVIRGVANRRSQIEHIIYVNKLMNEPINRAEVMHCERRFQYLIDLGRKENLNICRRHNLLAIRRNADRRCYSCGCHG